MEKMRHVGPTSYIYIYIYIYITTNGFFLLSSNVFIIFFILKFSLASLFDLRKSNRQNSSGKEAKCSTQ